MSHVTNLLSGIPFKADDKVAPMIAMARLLPALLLTLMATSASVGLAAEPAAADRPNIVFIFADDWGWGDLSCHGHPWLETPNLDRLAAGGTEFLQFNVVNPVCSPSRAAALTGQYPARQCIHQHFASPALNHERNMPDWLDPAVPTLPRLLREAGYRTGHFGKWHLTNRDTAGAPLPEAYGFDEAAVFNGGAEWPSADPHATAGNAARFIKANKDRAFYVNVWLHESHVPHVPTAESLERWKHLDEQRQVYAAVITDGDNAVGDVLDAIEAAGVAPDTIVIFSSDNGPEKTGGPSQRDKGAGYGTWCSVGDTGGLRGRKRSLFEGGVRVPFLVRWPGRATAGAKNDATVLTAVDLLPTLAAAAGVPLPRGFAGDGENLLEAFRGQAVVRTKPIFWQWLGTGMEPDWWPRLAVREGDWKLMLADDGRRVELHGLEQDRAEATDVAADHPDVVARLRALADRWQATLPDAPNSACVTRAETVPPTR